MALAYRGSRPPAYCVPGCPDDVCRALGECAWPRATAADLPDLRCPDCGHPRTGCGCSCTGPGTCGGGTDDIEGGA